EAAGGGAAVYAGEALRRYGEHAQRLLELEAPARDIGAGRAADFDLCVVLHGHAGLVRALAVYEHQAAHDGGPGLFPALKVAELHQLLVKSHAAHAISSFAAAAMP